MRDGLSARTHLRARKGLRQTHTFQLDFETAAPITLQKGEGTVIDWSQPHSLAKVTEAAGFTMSDVAFISGLDESTISRLWDDPCWLDRIRGRSLQALVASVPGVAEYFAAYSVLSRRNKLIGELETEGLKINRQALSLPNKSSVPHQYLINALEAALAIMRGDVTRATSLVARFWGMQQNRALEALYSTSTEPALLEEPKPLFEASRKIVPRLNRKGYSFHSIITKATFAHHLGIATGELDDTLKPSVNDRQSAFMVRSGIMGLLINSSDLDLAQRYDAMVSEHPVLGSIEEWSFPTYTRDSRPNVDFSLPGSILLRNTAVEIIREIDTYTDAYLYYLCTTYLPMALSRDPTFGLRITSLVQAIEKRIETCEETTVREACIDLTRQIKRSLS
jgi:hypothetical protein